ncbi:GerAB/ArcD/ProY family transporter [Paenibacillus thalictri]|uniref:Spore gernimation protein n=1 Tax=Paenibacillus thalictri TaxID=2527873 RepID=A0A4Q9DJR0_9BACL|nr:endospore germination permease [Paenibacillus thalictri]TBL74637.1 spore gernimation protein [Paenibacillus thalictri]
MKTNTITFFQTIMILMLAIGLMNHVIVIPILMDVAKRDAWISVLFTGGAASIWVILLYTALRKIRGIHPFQWLKEAYSPVVGNVLALIASFYMLVTCAVTLRDTSTWIHLTFLPKVPIIVLSFIFGMLCLFNAYYGIRSIANTAAILLPFVVLYGFFVMTANFPNKRYALLRPFLESGMHPVWHGMIYAGAGFMEIIIILFLQPHIRTKYSLLSLLVLTFILLGLTAGPVMGGIAEFGPEQMSKLRYPAYEEWRLITIGRYIEHLDFLSIYQWFSGAFVRISLTMFLIADILRIQNYRWKLGMLVFAFLISVAFSVYPFGDNHFLDMLRDYVLPGVIFVIGTYSLLLIILIHVKKRKEPSHDG